MPIPSAIDLLRRQLRSADQHTQESLRKIAEKCGTQEEANVARRLMSVRNLFRAIINGHCVLFNSVRLTLPDVPESMLGDEQTASEILGRHFASTDGEAGEATEKVKEVIVREFAAHRAAIRAWLAALDILEQKMAAPAAISQPKIPPKAAPPTKKPFPASQVVMKSAVRPSSSTPKQKRQPLSDTPDEPITLSENASPEDSEFELAQGDDETDWEALGINPNDPDPTARKK